MTASMNAPTAVPRKANGLLPDGERAMINGYHHPYVHAAIEGEISRLATATEGERNQALFKSSCALASLGLREGEILDYLKPVADGIGLHGREMYQTVKSGVRIGHANPRQIPNGNGHDARPLPQPARKVLPQPSGTFPLRSPPDDDGKRPVFFAGGDEGPRKPADEIRRHVYSRDGVPVRVKIKRASCAYVNWYRVTDQDGTSGWQAAKPNGYAPCPYVGAIDPFDRELIGDVIYWPEGERDVSTLGMAMLPAFTFGGTGDGLPEGIVEYLRGRQVAILADNDSGGRKHAENKAALVHAIASSVKVIEFPELPPKGDVTDFLNGNSTDDLVQRVEVAPLWISPSVALQSPVKASSRALVTCTLSDIAPEKIEWLWPGRIAVGKLTLIAGEPGLGKSQTTLFVAASVTIGARWPDSSAAAPLGNVIILSSEDGLADTTRPRFDAAGGDASRVGVIRAVDTIDVSGSVRGSFNLAADLALLEAEIIRRGDVRLVIIDPVSSYMGKIDSHKNADVRYVLEPISEMAERLRVAVLAITHLSKGDGRAINQFIGSIAFVAAARAAFTVVTDPEDEGGLRRLFLQVKNNIAAPAPGLAFRLEQREVAPGIIGSSLCWDNAPVNVTADQALGAGGDSGGQSAKDDAVEFLERVLAEGPVAVGEIEAEARAACLLGDKQSVSQSKPMRAARSALGVVVKREGFQKGARWLWSLPDSRRCPPGSVDALSQDRASTGGEGIYGGSSGREGDSR